MKILKISIGYIKNLLYICIDTCINKNKQMKQLLLALTILIGLASCTKPEPIAPSKPKYDYPTYSLNYHMNQLEYVDIKMHSNYGLKCIVVNNDTISFKNTPKDTTLTFLVKNHPQVSYTITDLNDSTTKLND